MDNLEKRKAIAAKVLGVGKRKILFDTARLAEIKEAITRQDIRDLYAEGIIMIKEKSGRRVNVKRNNKRGPGKIRKKVRDRKGSYMKLIRKLRWHLSELRKQDKLTDEQYADLRTKVKARTFKDKAHLKEHIGGFKK